MRFLDIFKKYDWQQVQSEIYSKTAADVERALQKPSRNLEDFKALLSPAAAAYLEPMAQLSHRLTVQRFGKVISLYVPLYLSNECQNICTYCGFSLTNRIPRRTLTEAEILRELEAIRQMGFEHVLLVTGEANHTVGMPYFERALRLIVPSFANVSMEVQPLDEKDYCKLVELGVYAVLVYQETYRQATYRQYHPKGKKSNFFYRLDTPDRLGRAGVHKIGLGALIGLEDWRVDSFFVGLHLDYLRRRYWQTKYSISFPRLRPHEGDFLPRQHMNDRELVQLICAYRLFDADVELSLSTRESPRFRDHAIRLGITSMSAGSRTNPGGYAVDPQTLEQFETHDNRSPAEVAAMIQQQGYEAVWKDWDASLFLNQAKYAFPNRAITL